MKSGSSLLGLLAAIILAAGVARAAAETEEGFTVIFDGKSMDGWKVSENPNSFTLEDGALVAKGERAHAFYVGAEKPFKDFELKVDVMTKPNSNGGIYFHTQWQETGWPTNGFEVQVNNSYAKDRRKTGSLYAVKDVMDNAPAKDNVWFTEHIIVKGDTVTIKVDGKTVTEYTQPSEKPAGGESPRKRLGQGTFALQAHDPNSTVYYKNIRVKRLD